MIRSKRITISKLRAWLMPQPVLTNGRYRFRLITEIPQKRSPVIDEVKEYVREAHEDARNRLRGVLSPTLSPFTPNGADPADGYPEELAESDLMGYFGEVMAGLIAEHEDVHGFSGWKIPAFLFRFH
ncbi:MAG: hypothetical protein V1738_00325, partial [Patescibacteria group bacterium]